MSPLSRGRKSRRSPKGARRVSPLGVVGPADECDCPACSGVDLDPQQVIDGLIGALSELAAVEDPLDAELGAASLLSVGASAPRDSAPEGFEEMLLGGLIPQFEARAGSEALAVLTAIGSVARGEIAEAAQAAAGRLVAVGVAQPKWAGELADPVTLGECCRLYDVQGTASMLVCSFHRSGRGHAMVVAVDHADCGAASDILLVDAADLGQVLEAMRTSGRKNRLDIRSEPLEPAELRWQIENALDARAMHDSDPAGGASDESIGDEDGPGYPALAVLMRARMDTLPTPDKPPAPHADIFGEPVLRSLQEPATGLAPKRKKSAGPAPIYQIKVGLRGAKPPIWRRLEVPADVNLARLHLILQLAFGWNGGHMHVFETPFGDFGTADAKLGYRADKLMTLEQVAPAVNSRIRYLYDFGDDWDHDILVEKIVDRDQAARYPRCTGGRRAAPPDDCGGVWGYLELIDILSDPDHPEHEERLDWLGIDAAADFTPNRFDAGAINQALSSMK